MAQNEKDSIQFTKTTGSQITGRDKDKRERIYEAMCDLQLAIDGFRTQQVQSEEPGLFQQSCAVLLAFVRFF